jgi:hypothetical protein
MKDTLIVCSEAIFKKCSKCGEHKEIINFYKHSGVCKKCKITRNKTQRNKNNRIKYLEKYNKINALRISKRTKIYRETNKQKIKEKQKLYYLKHRTYILEKQKTYSSKNKETIHRYQKIHYHQNKRKKFDYYNNRIKSDNDFKVLMNTKRYIRNIVKNNKIGSNNDLICCTIQQYRNNLETQFKVGMNWENYGKVWHVDHIIPVSFFDVSDLTEQKLAFHWGNTQPLFTKENLEKSDKIPENTNFKYL